jgi:threonine/homoserine/homoserine lactone efflux protein
METSLLLKGLIIGFSIAAPVGPIGVLCIRRTLANGGLAGFVSGMGAATADAIYGCIAGFGLTFISNILISQQTLLRLIGGIFLCYLGIKIFRDTPAEHAARASGDGLPAQYASTFVLTLTNPMTIISFAAIFAGMGLATSGHSYASAGVLVAGVFAGSALWWLLLSSGANMLRSRFNPQMLVWVNRLAGIIIVTFGLLSFVSLL